MVLSNKIHHPSHQKHLALIDNWLNKTIIFAGWNASSALYLRFATCSPVLGYRQKVCIVWACCAVPPSATALLLKRQTAKWCTALPHANAALPKPNCLKLRTSTPTPALWICWLSFSRCCLLWQYACANLRKHYYYPKTLLQQCTAALTHAGLCAKLQLQDLIFFVFPLCRIHFGIPLD